jgi:hypothetical protein
MAFPGSAWKYVPSSGVPTPPRCVPPWVRTGVGLWRGALVAPRHWLKSGSAGRAPAASGRSEGCLQRRTTEGPVGVLVASAPQQSLAASVHHIWRMCTAMPARRTSTGGLRTADGARTHVLLALNSLHRMEQDYPLNLSISLSGGKETNRDAPSNGE